MRPNALLAMNNSAQLFMKHLMNRSVQQATRRSALEVMEDMVDMERSARRFPSKAARVFQSRNHPRNATRCQRRTANRFQSKFRRRTANRFQRKTASKSPKRTADRFQSRTALKCLFKNQPKLPNKSVKVRDLDMDTINIVF